MEQVKKDHHDDQFEYLGRWVSKKGFRAFVYNAKGEDKLADSYQQYSDLIASGVWFSSKLEASTKVRKQNDSVRPTSK